MAKKSGIAGAALWLIGQNLFLNLLSLPATAFIIRQVGAEGYGQWATASSLVAAGGFLATLGLGTLFARRVAQHPEEAAEALAEQLGLRGLLAVALCLTTSLLCLGLGYSGVVTICVIIATVGFLFSNIASTFADLLQGFGQVKVYAQIMLAAGLLLTLATVLAAGGGYGAIGLTTAYLVGPAAQMVLLCLFVWRRHFPIRLRWDLGRYRTLLHAARVVGAKQALLGIQSRAEYLLLPKLAGMEASGYFFAGTLLASRLAVFTEGFATAAYSAIASVHNNDKETQARQTLGLFRISLAVCLPLSALIAFLAAPIAALLFPAHAEVCRTIILITIWSLPLMGAANAMNYSMEALGRPSEAAKAGIQASLWSMLVTVLLTTGFGLIGACWSWVIRPLILVCCLLPYFREVCPTVLRRVPLGRLLCAAVAMSLPLWVASGWGASTLWTMAGALLLATITYVVVLIALRVIEMSEIKAVLLPLRLRAVSLQKEERP